MLYCPNSLETCHDYGYPIRNFAILTAAELCGHDEAWLYWQGVRMTVSPVIAIKPRDKWEWDRVETLAWYLIEWPSEVI